MAPPLTLFHMSDPHFGAEDGAALAWFAAAVARERPDMVVCTGDITMRGVVREFEAAARWFAQLAPPVRIEPGNHDMPYYWEMRRRLRTPYTRFARFRRSMAPPAPRPDVVLVSLRTIVPAQRRLNWAQGKVPPARLASACARLQAAPAGALKLVLTHHPLAATDARGLLALVEGKTRGGRQALAALARAEADAVLSGHVHDPFDLAAQIDGRSIRLIGAGTLSTRQRTTPPSYNRIEWDGAGGLSATPVFQQ